MLLFVLKYDYCGFSLRYQHDYDVCRLYKTYTKYLFWKWIPGITLLSPSTRCCPTGSRASCSRPGSCLSDMRGRSSWTWRREPSPLRNPSTPASPSAARTRPRTCTCLSTCKSIRALLMQWQQHVTCPCVCLSTGWSWGLEMWRICEASPSGQ